jgi:hypothetical protein
MATTDAPDGGTHRQRSPGYPALDLNTAIERVVDLYRVSPKHPVPLTVAAEEWGYSAKSSSTKTVAAALKRFGLVRDVGNSASRQLALTDEGRELAFLNDERSGDRWQHLVEEAALRPKIHRQVLDHFGGPLPDDRVVLRYLLFELGFADEATARDFLRRLHATLDLAGIRGTSVEIDEATADTQPRPGGSEPTTSDSRNRQWNAPVAGPAEGGPRLTPPTPSIYDHFSADRSFVQIPYSHDKWATLQAAFPLTSGEWDFMISMLQAMKPGLVNDDPGEST